MSSNNETWYSKNKEVVLAKKKQQYEKRKLQKNRFLIELWDPKTRTYKSTSLIINTLNGTVESTLVTPETFKNRTVGRLTSMYDLQKNLISTVNKKDE